MNEVQGLMPCTIKRKYVQNFINSHFQFLKDDLGARELKGLEGILSSACRSPCLKSQSCMAHKHQKVSLKHQTKVSWPEM